MTLKVLFVHDNYPAQFGRFGVHLAGQGWDVTFATMSETAEPPKGCRMFKYAARRTVSDGVHRYLAGTERAVLGAQGFASSAIAVSNGPDGYVPDIVVGHSGWGAGLFAKVVWPDCVYVPYLEWWYHWPAVDIPDGVSDPDKAAQSRVRNTPFLLDMMEADAVLCPTQFQASQVPDIFRPKLEVMHDGVDTDAFRPPDRRGRQIGDLDLSHASHIVTYLARGMEPQRGFPEFMRSLPDVMRSFPAAEVVVVGEDRVAYGSKLPEGDSWKRRMLAELDLDLSRIHFTGLIPPRTYRQLLHATDLHVHLSVPFVLSWSFVEAMAAGAPLVASDTAPIREALHGVDAARCVVHEDPNALRDAMCEVLERGGNARAMGQRARQVAVAHYAQNKLYPQKAAFLMNLIASRHAAAVGT